MNGKMPYQNIDSKMALAVSHRVQSKVSGYWICSLRQMPGGTVVQGKLSEGVHIVKRRIR
jgi:hypothetical protein